MFRLRSLASRGLLACAVLAAGCEPPKYVEYHSELGDYTCAVPYGWNVYFDRQENAFTSYTFVGPFDPDFFLGLPSLSVRWHANFKVHRLRDGSAEIYASADDYVRRTLDEVYGSKRQMIQEVHRVAVSGWEGRHFIVESMAEVPDKFNYGVEEAASSAGPKTAVARRHAYVILPMDNGFYVLVYPATRGGFEKYEKQFNHLVNTFKVHTDGPGGSKV